MRGGTTPVHVDSSGVASESTSALLLLSHAYLGSKRVTWLSMRLFFSVIVVLLAEAR